MKKIIVCLIGMMLVMGLVGCSAEDHSEENVQGETVTDNINQESETDENDKTDEWYELDDENCVLTLKLEDPEDDVYEWIIQNHYENVVKVESEKHEDGMYIITLSASMQEYGDAQIALQYTDSWDEDVQNTIVIDLSIDENGMIKVETASRL